MATINDLKVLINNPKEMVNFLVDLIGEDFDGPVGLRGMYDGEKLGKLRKSAVWVDNNRTSKKLFGTSAVEISRNWSYQSYREIVDNIVSNARKVFSYGDGRIALVVGEYGEAGEDNGEVIISSAKAIYIWEH